MRTGLILRAPPGSDATARAVGGLGWRPHLCPVAMAEPVGGPVPVEGVQALLMTSAQAARLAPVDDGLRRLPVWCVGDATAAAAREAGWRTVRSAGGDAAALARAVAAALVPGAGTLLHLRGEAVAGDPAAGLQARGFRVAAQVIYRMAPRPGAGAELEAVLARQGGLVLVHAPSQGHALAQAAGAARPGAWRVVAISPAALAPLQGLAARWSALAAAASPDEAAMLRLAGSAPA